MPLQIIHHPVVDSSLKYANTTVGRDKVFKGVQFFARFLAWYLNRINYDKETIKRLSSLKSTIASSRKLMRTGKFVEHLQQASKALKEKDEIARFTTVGRRLGYTVYLFCDSLLWAHSTGVYKFEQIKKITEIAYKFWIFGLTSSIIHCLYKLHQNGLKKNFFEKNSRSKNIESSEKISSIDSEVIALRRQLLQDIFDIMIPTTSLGYIHLEDGIVGLAGVLSAIIGAKMQWEKVNGAK
ncbi:peroxisomal biogenesis factor 11 [Gigaspora rosea]|uniref:Peroxisomal biogenesis factor 11 n=1 Tax=Gigaspora rosea TaxID=44941 RepID=A0A397UQ32_9GLOM|nr:peroxisomal biogenesis factor 11 [Gigaspora rosea]